MIIGFHDRATQDIYDGNDTKAARHLPESIKAVAQRKLDMINAAHELRDLASPPGNRLEALSGRLVGFHSIRINDQYRIVFKFKDGNTESVRITAYH